MADAQAAQAPRARDGLVSLHRRLACRCPAEDRAEEGRVSAQTRIRCPATCAQEDAGAQSHWLMTWLADSRGDWGED